MKRIEITEKHLVRRKVDCCDYGIVLIVNGRYKGFLGYYDDDDCGSGVNGIVYPDGHDGYVVVRLSSLRKSTKKEAARFIETLAPWLER